MSPGERLDPLPDPFILQPPVFHPVVPYVTTIFGGLRAGKMVILQGMVPLHARRFQVDFQCGCSLYPRPDIAIHFNPRLHTTKPHVICNTLYLERWQAEARWPHLDLQRGASFLILFLFGNEEMKVSVNGQHFLHYRYRLPLARVDTLGIFGDILVEAVGFLNINPFPEGGSEYPVGYLDLVDKSQLPLSCCTVAMDTAGNTSVPGQLGFSSPLSQSEPLGLGRSRLAAQNGRSPHITSKRSFSGGALCSQRPQRKLGLACRAEGEMRPKAMPPFLLKSPSLEVPCSRALPKGLWPGQVIVLRGLVLPEPKDFTLSLRDEAARVPVTLRASFADRTLAWISPWGCKKLISAPFLFYPRRFFEVLLLCQEGGLKLALNGQGLGATSVHQRVLEQLREFRVSGSVQLYCVHH